MKSTIAVCALLLTCVHGSAASEETQGGPGAMLSSWAAAWRTGDIDKMLAFYEQSNDVVAIASSGRRYAGKAGVRRMYEQAFGEADWREVELRDVKVLQDGNMAWTTCRFKAVMRVKLNDTTLVFTSQGSILVRRSGERWRIVLEHFSPIADVPRLQFKQ
jgi:uncharacterized protein (TIGR02246 family)